MGDGVKGVAPVFLNLGTQMKVTGQSHALTALLLEKKLKSRSGLFGKEKNLPSFTGFEPRFIQPDLNYT
jgi:hypothetical protein